MKKKGFTLIELLISFAIFSLIVVALIAILVTMLGLQTDQSAAAEVNQQGQALLQQVQYYISSARLVDMTQDVATGTLTVREFSTPYPTNIALTSGVVYITAGNTSPQPLSSGNVTVSNLSFTRHFNLNGSSTPYGTDSVSFSFTVSAASTNNKQYTQSFQSSASVLAPVGKIAMIQEAESSYWCNTCGDQMSLAYPGNNEAGDLLIAVVNIEHVSPTSTYNYATISMGGTGTIWTPVVMASDSAYGGEQTFIAAYTIATSTISPVTVNVSDNQGFVSSSIFLFEYRGIAATATLSFDASSSQIQGNTANPSSGFANPTSTVELVLGVTHDDNTTDIPSAGPGFTLEASSTYETFVEDDIQYITGPVAATWQYATTPTSSSAVATFK